MANTFTKISTVTVGAGGVGSISFTSIPQTYTDLCILSSLASSTAPQTTSFVSLYINGGVSGMSLVILQGTGSNKGSYVDSNAAYVTMDNTTQANVFTSTSMYFPNYSNTSIYKSYSFDNAEEGNQTYAIRESIGGTLSNTSAITSLTLYACNSSLSNNQSFAQYSKATLYGIKNS